jgi:hypothetical protein
VAGRTKEHSMPVTVDHASAARLTAEGAICFNTDTSTATRDGHPVPWPVSRAQRNTPILVCGSSGDTVQLVAGQLERQGLAAWQVADRPASQTSTGAGALSRAE